MHVIVVANQKGGVGKTTLSGHLAVEAVRTESGNVVLIDTDPQGSLSQWWHERKAETPHLAQIEPAKLKAQLAILKSNGIDIAIIDTLSQYGTVAPVTIFQRTDFASSMIDGRTVQESDDKRRSANEIAELWTYVHTQVRKT